MRQNLADAHPAVRLGRIGSRTSLLTVVQAVALSGCAPRADSPRPLESLDAPVTADGWTAEASSDARGIRDASQDTVDAAAADSDGGADAIADSTGDSSAADAGPSPCNQPGDARDGGRPYFDLVVGGRWKGEDGRRIFVLTREYGSMLPRGYGSAVIKEEMFMMRFPRAYLNFSYQLIFYFLDIDDDGRCDPTIDPTGRSVTNACQMRDCEGAASEKPIGAADAEGNQICDLMNFCR